MLTFLTGLLPACTRRDKPPPASPLKVVLQASFDQTGSTLVVDYQVANDASVPVVVFNGVPAKETTSTPKPDPNAVYVTAGSDGTVQLAKRLFPVPDGVHPAAQFLMRGSVLAPGARLTERVVVPLPLQPRVPYADAGPKRPPLPDPVRRVTFCVGIARQDALHPVPSDSGDADPHPVYAHASGVEAVQRLSCSVSYDLRP